MVFSKASSSPPRPLPVYFKFMSKKKDFRDTESPISVPPYSSGYHPVYEMKTTATRRGNKERRQKQGNRCRREELRLATEGRSESGIGSRKNSIKRRKVGREEE